MRHGGYIGAGHPQSGSARPRLLCFPSTDQAFARVVDETAGSIPVLTPAALVDGLLPLYPRVFLQRRDLSGVLATIWYVYRERTFPAYPDDVID